MWFSERKGFIMASEVIQKDGMNDELRNSGSCLESMGEKISDLQNL